jgi:hypothetical protein
VTPSALRLRFTDDKEYLNDVREFSSIEAEAKLHDEAYAEGLVAALNGLVKKYGSRLQPHSIAVLTPYTDERRLNAVRMAVARRLEPGPMQDAVRRADVYRADGLLWCAVEFAIGLERPIVLCFGFRDPHRLVDRFKAGQLHSKVDGLLYQAMTRCTFLLLVIEPHAEHYVQHLAIHLRDENGIIPYFGANSETSSGLWICGNDDSAELPHIQLSTIIDLSAASLNSAFISTAVSIRCATPVSRDAWRRSEWKSCAPNLRTLDLTQKLQQATSMEVLQDVVNLVQLQHLYLDNNQLSAVPEGVSTLTALQDLYLQTNQLSAVPEGISTLTALQDLYLDNDTEEDDISDADAEST